MLDTCNAKRQTWYERVTELLDDHLRNDEGLYSISGTMIGCAVLMVIHTLAMVCRLQNEMACQESVLHAKFGGAL